MLVLIIWGSAECRKWHLIFQQKNLWPLLMQCFPSDARILFRRVGIDIRTWCHVTLWISVKDSWMFSRENNYFDDELSLSSSLSGYLWPVTAQFIYLCAFYRKKRSASSCVNQMFYWACYIAYGLKATSKKYLTANMLIMNSFASHWLAV